METRQNEQALIAKYLETRDASVKEEIILRYIPLVHFVLGRLGISRSLGQDYEDAVSQGLLGLIEALDRYDPNHGTQFSTYATLRIRGNIIDQLRSHDWLPRGARQRARQVQDAIEVLWEQLQRVPTDEELAIYTKFELPKLKQALVDSSHLMISLDTQITTEGEEVSSLYEILADDKELQPADAFENQELKEFLIECLKQLPEREQLVLSLYYDQNLTFKELGKVLDVSESRICQLHARAIMTLRSRLKKLAFDYETETGKPGYKTDSSYRSTTSFVGGYGQ